MSNENQIEPIQSVQQWFDEEGLSDAEWLLKNYLDTYRGARFDQLSAHTDPFVIEEDDLKAVRSLSIGFPRSFVACLATAQGSQRVREALVKIPTDEILDQLSDVEFEKLLGPESAAWQAWEELATCLKQARSRSPMVSASKLLAAKRPMLIPVEDSLVRKVFGVPRRDIWKTIHQLVRDPFIGKQLDELQQRVPTARNLPSQRILDIIAWRKAQGHRQSNS